MILDQIKITEISPSAKFNIPMATHTTFHIGGNADCVVYPSSFDEIKAIVNYAKSENIPFTILGNGSNVLVSDDGIEGIVIRIDDNLSDIEVNDNVISASAGALLSKVASKAYKNSLGGFEFAAGIPGTVGGAMVMNAGAYGGEMKDIVKDVVVLTKEGEIITLTNEEMCFDYRTSTVKEKGYIVLSASFLLDYKEASIIKGKMDELKEKRTSKQPLNMPSAGSTFKRPEGYFAGALIEESGLRGYKIGGAQVSIKHCGFVVNDGNATAKDVLELVNYIKETVYKNSGVMLEPEVKHIGRFYKYKPLTFSEEVKEELNNKVEMLPIKKKRDAVEEAMRDGTAINVPFDGPDRDKRAMLKGAFLGSGLISDPIKSYHIEFQCKTIEHGRFILLMLGNFDIRGKLATRKNGYGVYIKDSEDITKLLSIMGANKALFKMQDAIILHELKNDVNRKVNCETANIKKATDAAARQISDIRLLDKNVGIENLKTSLSEVCYLRLENPDKTLVELGQMLTPVVGKSGMNHRFRQIHALAMEYKNE